MKINEKKLLKVAVPLAIGGGTLYFMLALEARKESSSPPVAQSESQPAAPQSAAHEKAALEEQLAKKPGHPPILLRLAELEREAGRPAGAVPYLQQALKQEPKNEEARLELGRALYESGNVEGALRETQQLVADYPNHVDGLYNLGAIYANLNQNQKAREYWTKAIATAPESDSGRKARDGLAQLSK